MFYYHFHEKLARFSNVKIVYDMDKLILISDHRDNQETKLQVPDEEYDEKANLIEYFSQTGSYYKINDRYTWTQGIYNIINRTREENDEREMLKLLYQTMRMLTKRSIPLTLVRYIFELKAIAIKCVIRRFYIHSKL